VTDKGHRGDFSRGLPMEGNTMHLTRPTLNRARAIREFCAECMGYQIQLINRCPDTACPLWEWRRGPGGPERTISPLRRQTHTRNHYLHPPNAFSLRKVPMTEGFREYAGRGLDGMCTRRRPSTDRPQKG